MAAVAPDSHRSLLTWADPLGSTGALLCAIHCAAWPFLLTLLPALGLSFFGSEAFERGFVVGAAVLGAASLGTSYRRHRRLAALAVLLPGLAILVAGVAFPNLHRSAFVHAITMTAGGILVSTSHLINMRMARRFTQAPCRRK